MSEAASSQAAGPIETPPSAVADGLGEGFPHLVRAEPGAEDAVAWLEQAMPRLEPQLHRCGALLFRGFALGDAEDFRRAVAAMAPQLRDYTGGTSPRSRVAEGVYTSTEYPKHLEIPLHNEMSYSVRWPQRLYFFCAVAPQTGGETPIADSRRILQAMPAQIVDEFERRQLTYVRNLASAQSPYNAWSKAFETQDREQVEAYCREMDIGYEWQRNGGLRIHERRPATRLHPATGERVWFNQVHLFHASNTPMGGALSAQIEAGLPMAAYYGDGGRIDNATLASVREVLNAHRRGFRWRQGDLLVVDNLLAAHGRLPFDGPRRILVAMS
ncbi:TauD/TfdA family dioxygenase [Lysobacter sp. BMK333-48F3]|uniref:TauD/TfdA family dioxygenase n=1 Tax=Lysobacter sp. BMK333-48F3 TaxID=2867962 RepID=UPI001C8C79DF|nr:TauD/TfdA family dioxygenase [Lysobacter sp. BMK333-48F3]MBX9403191.1 TauD/TfdA family dioxygenase [Lysobacter sp. BMK333-48F3]